MASIRQDMPPPGGFSPVIYERIPLKKPWPLYVRWLIPFALMGFGWQLYHIDKKRIIYEAIEKRSAWFSILPLLVAENDRIRLRKFIELRKEEADLMKNVKGWKVGTYFGEPIYKTLKPNEWYEPHPMEMWVHTDMKDWVNTKFLRRMH